ncbi:hypothetical protein KEM52_000403, partial [Ascosphaera acerosa]
MDPAGMDEQPQPTASASGGSGSGSGSPESPGLVRPKTSLPASRIKAIVKEDDDIGKLSNPATFAISAAAELFINYLTRQAHVAMKAEGRKTMMQYRDIAAAIARIDNLEFLVDVVPRVAQYDQSGSPASGAAA